jgi:uncharacterized protein (DUF1330 family)
MPAYVILDIDVKNRDSFSRYVQEVAPMLARWGARYLVRGGEVDVLEGDWSHHTVVILEFPSRAVAEQFYESEEYAPLLKLRLDSTDCMLAILEGYEG